MLFQFLIQGHCACKTSTVLLYDKCKKSDHFKALVAVHLGSVEDYVSKHLWIQDQAIFCKTVYVSGPILMLTCTDILHPHCFAIAAFAHLIFLHQCMSGSILLSGITNINL